MVFRRISDFLGIRGPELPELEGGDPACDVDKKVSEPAGPGEGESSDFGSTAGCCSSGGSTGSTSPGPRWQLVEPMTQSSLEELMKDVSSNVTSWDAASFVHVKTLQDAIKNHTHVDHMEQFLEGSVRSVAVKRLPNRWMQRGPEEFKAQQPQAAERPWCDLGIVKYLNSISFPFACDLLGVCRDEENTYAITSLATNGNLFYWCDHDPRPGPSREKVMHPIVRQIFTGITWLHKLGLAHRDISLENILLTDGADGGLQVKIIDFAMATPTRVCHQELRGKPSYQAPEMHADSDYDAFLADAFSLGVVVFAMAVKDYPWASTKPDACALFGFAQRCGLRKFFAKRRLRNGLPDEHLADVVSPALAELLEGLMKLEPEQRFALGEACFNPPRTHTSVWDTEWLQSNSPVGFQKDGSNRLAGG